MAIAKNGTAQAYSKGQVIYSLDFEAELYLVDSGYVKRYSVTNVNSRVVQAIYGPGYFFPLTPVIRKFLSFDVSEEHATYVYEAITDVEIRGVSINKLAATAKTTPAIYEDILFEAARRLKSNIHRLQNIELPDSYKKLAHHLTYLAQEFGKVSKRGVKTGMEILFPLTAVDMAEQLNLSTESARESLDKLQENGLIRIAGDIIRVPDINLLKDVYF